MQLEPRLKYWREDGALTALPQSWRMPLARLTLVWLGIFAFTLREWGQMLHQWWNIDTYNHILLIPIVVIWLIVLRAKGARELSPNHWLPGIGLLTIALALWLVGRASDINFIAQVGAVGALQASVLLFLGPRIVAYLLLPVGMTAFLVPFGDEIIPFLQTITAEITITLTKLSGIEATYEGIFIDTPVGLFIVAEECSGVKFLIAMVTLGTLVSFTSFDSWIRRALFMIACVIVPIIANGIRAWSTIYIAQSQGVEFAAGFDHIVYGWVFFAIVMVIVLGGAYRYFEREPEDAGYSLEELDGMNWLAKFEQRTGNANAAMLMAFILMLGFAMAAIYAGPAFG